MTYHPKVKACVLFTLSVLLSNCYADKARLLCYLQNKVGNQPIELSQTSTELKDGLFQDVVTYNGQAAKVFIPGGKTLNVPSYFYPYVWSICSGINRGNAWVRGYAVAGPDGSPVNISFPNNTFDDPTEIFNDLVHTHRFSKSRSTEILGRLSMTSSKVMREGVEHTMTDKDFFADYTDDTYRNVDIVLLGVHTRLSQIVGPLNMLHPTREEIKRRLTTFIYTELNKSVPNSAKASQAAASFIINYAQPIGNLLATATDSSLYISRLEEPTSKQQSFVITPAKDQKDSLVIVAKAVVAYPGYISASGHAITTPFEVDFTLPFAVNYTNYRNNDYQQNPAVIVDQYLFEKINLVTTDQTLRDAVWGAWLDDKPGRTLKSNWGFGFPLTY